MSRSLATLGLFLVLGADRVTLARGQSSPEVLHVDSVVPSAHQPHEGNPAVIWYDSFDGPESSQAAYLEYQAGSPGARRTDREALGGKGHSIELTYARGSQGVGGRKLVFGDCPFGRPVRQGEHFEDVYWRIYVKHQKGWRGAPAKMSRATGFVSDRWNQAFILHVWSGRGDTLTLDPARGVKDGAIVTTKYNDFPHLSWLGNSPSGNFPLHAPEEANRWVCVEARLKLNTPGQKDGYAALWVDGVLDTERSGMDFRGAYTDHTINAVFLEAYWNEGSPVDQVRWFDDFVVSTKPIGPLTAPPNPTLLIALDAPVEVEIASDVRGSALVWKSRSIRPVAGQVVVEESSGSFTGEARGRASLGAGPTYCCRVRPVGGTWSGWHQPFLVEGPRAK
jgi:hypothetical protein